MCVPGVLCARGHPPLGTLAALVLAGESRRSLSLTATHILSSLFQSSQTTPLSCKMLLNPCTPYFSNL